MKKNNRIEINLGGGLKLVAERNSNSNYDREIMIGLESKGGWMQDLALVRPGYTYETDDQYEYGKIKWKNDAFDVLVWADSKNDDITNYFEIARYNPDEE